MTYPIEAEEMCPELQQVVVAITHYIENHKKDTIKKADLALLLKRYVEHLEEET